MIQQSDNKIIVALLMFALVFQVLFAPWLADYKVSHLRKLIVAYQNQDTMLVCTGKSMKWASQQAFMDTGRLVFVEPPKDIPKKQIDVECSNSLLIKFSSFLLTNFAFIDNAWQRYLAVVVTLIQRPYTAYPYTTWLSRAPPQI